MRVRPLTVWGLAGLTGLVFAGCGIGGVGGGQSGGGGAAGGNPDDGGGGGGAKAESDQVIKTLLKAAIDRDGKTYCGQLTFQELEAQTGETSDAATKECEQQVVSGNADYPGKFTVAESQPKGANDSEVKIEGNVPSGVIKLKREGGKLKVDSFE